MATPPKAPPIDHGHKTGHSWLERKSPDEPYVHQEFPKSMHHPTKAPVVVQDPDEERFQLGAGFTEAVPDPAEAPDDTAALLPVKPAKK
jgi:hypothetical protein